MTQQNQDNAIIRSLAWEVVLGIIPVLIVGEIASRSFSEPVADLIVNLVITSLIVRWWWVLVSQGRDKDVPDQSKPDIRELHDPGTGRSGPMQDQA